MTPLPFVRMRQRDREAGRGRAAERFRARRHPLETDRQLARGLGFGCCLTLPTAASRLAAAREVGGSRMLESPAQIGPYRLLPPALGQGAMGVVYRARHLSSERPCALKTVTVTGALWMDGIRREIQALQHVRHPGIVLIHDHGIHDGVPWYAMDLLEGESLRAFGQRIWSRFR